MFSRKVFFFFISFYFYSSFVWAQDVDKNILVAVPVSEKVVVDGIADDAVWGKAMYLIAEVEDGTIGDIKINIQAAYDHERIYFFIRWADDTKNVLNRAWVFNPRTKEWKTKLREEKLSLDCLEIDDIENEDQFSINWNIDNTIKGFNVIGCQVLCHGDRMHTNGPNERADIWHWKSARTNPLDYVDDKWLDNKVIKGWGQQSVEAARNGDLWDKTAGLDGFDGNYAVNSQTIITAQGETITIPMYWEPNAVGDDAEFITQEEIRNGEAVKIVDSSQLDRSRSIPGYILFRPQGSRGNIDAKGLWKNGFWNLEISRKLKTGNKDDVQFDIKHNYRFGIAVMDKIGGFHGYRRGHSFSIQSYTLQFGGHPSLITSHLMIIKDYITMSHGYFKKKNAELAISELNHAKKIIDDIDKELAEADPERFLKFKKSIIETRLHLTKENLIQLMATIDEFIDFSSGKIKAAPLTLSAYLTLYWIKFQSYVFLILGIFAAFVLVSLFGILKRKPWKHMGVFLFMVILPIFIEGVGRLGIVTDFSLLKNLSFMTDEYSRMLFALIMGFAIYYSRRGFRDIFQSEEKLKNEITIRQQAEESLQKAHDELEKKIELRTADLAKANKELQQLSAHLQGVRENERISIAREIHDELGQLLATLKIDFSNLVSELPKDNKKQNEKLGFMLEFVELCIQAVQSISSGLRPSILDNLGIVSAMDWHAEDYQKRTGIECEVTFDTEDIILDKERSLAVFRVFQETLTNIARHADATKILVSLKKEGDNLILKITDNGNGISEKEISSPKSYGIIGMRERASFLGGNLMIEGVEGKGTTVILNVPFDKKENTP